MNDYEIQKIRDTAFCSGYNTAVSKYENKIADLEDKLANADFQLEGRDNEIAGLEQENKVLAQNLEDTEIVNKALEKENAELKEKLKDANEKVVHLACNQNKDLKKENAELKSENQKWKDEWQEQVQKATDEGYARTLQTIQLTTAKEIIKTFLGFAEAFGYSPSMDKFITEAEQFLKE